MLLFGAIGLAAVFTLETVTAVFTLDQSAIDAIYGSAKTLVTVDPNPKVADGPGLVQAVHLGHDGRRAAARGRVHRRAS